MRNYIILNGISSNTISGLLISTLPSISKPKQRTQTEEIDGRDGDIVTKLGYSAYDKIIEIGLYGDFDINEVISYFNSEGTVVFSNEADKYYNYQILDQIDYEKLIRFKTAKVKMHVQPFKYPLQEEQIQVDATVVQASGTDIRLEYTTPNASIDTEVEGKSEQEGTPTPANPVEVKTVSGIGNLFDIDNETIVKRINTTTINVTNKSIVVNKSDTTMQERITIYKQLKPNTTYSISTGNQPQSSDFYGAFIAPVDSISSSAYPNGTEGLSSTATTNSFGILAIIFYIPTNYSGMTTITNIQLEEGTIAHTPVPYGHWLPVKVSNRNLFDMDNANILNAYINNKTIITLASARTLYIPCKSDTTYTISKIQSTRFTVISTVNTPANNVVGTNEVSNTSATSLTITTGSSDKYLAVFYYYSNSDILTEQEILNSIQIEEGSTATDYIEHQEQVIPVDLNQYDESNNIIGNYELCSIGDVKDTLTFENGVAKITKNIDKVLLNGSESWADRPNYNSADRFVVSALIYAKSGSYGGYSNYFYSKNPNDQTDYPYIAPNSTQIIVNFSEKNTTTLQEFKAWLSTHNTEFYYQLATPEEIELNGDYNIKAYDQVTYMTTEGNLIPVINAKTNGMPNTIVTNIGNIYAKPLITIYGSGDIGVYLNNQHVLQIALGDNESITIDVSKMEAYDKNTKVLMNRLVTGDYMKFLINSGENEIAFSGTVAGFTMDNYTRWL